jgi:hypothetical protein
MKRLLITLIMLISVILSGMAQDKLKIGDVKNGQLKITNVDGLKAFFLNTIGKSGTLGKDFQVSTAPEGDRYFVYYRVTGNRDAISSIGVLLVKIKNEVFIVKGSSEKSPGSSMTGPGAGGSATISCIGNPCDSCTPEVTWPAGNWLPLIICACNSGGHCNMSISFSVNINIGL